MKYYIADMHFGYDNVIRFDGRLFSSANEMERYIIDAWNTRVKEEDAVYIIGDFAYRASHSVEYYASQLNGQKYNIS